MMKPRPYDFDLTPFADGAVAHVQVHARNRAIAFTLAALQATDPANVWKVALVRDNGRILDPDDVQESHRVPQEYDSQQTREPMDLDGFLEQHTNDSMNLTTPRGYDVGLELFGGGGTGFGIRADRRVESFTRAALDSATPDAVYEIELRGVGADQPDIIYETDPTQKYGGVTVDLTEPTRTGRRCMTPPSWWHTEGR